MEAPPVAAVTTVGSGSSATPMKRMNRDHRPVDLLPDGLVLPDVNAGVKSSGKLSNVLPSASSTRANSDSNSAAVFASLSKR